MNPASADSCAKNARARLRHVQRARWRDAASWLTLGLSTAFFFCGCHKKSETTPAPAPFESASSVATNAPDAFRPAAQALPPSSQTIAANASAEEVAGQLTLELRRYVAYTHDIPKSFEDFAARDPIKFPPPPAGKKYVLTGGKIVLQ